MQASLEKTEHYKFSTRVSKITFNFLNKHWCSLCSKELIFSSTLYFSQNSSFCYDCYRGILNAKRCLFEKNILLTRNAHLEIRKPIFLYSIFGYQTKIKALVLESKIRGNPRTLSIIESIISHDRIINRIVEQTTQISICPSSLWSRYHGRTDLASFMAEKTMGETQFPIDKSLFPWHFGFTKRSKLKAKKSIKTLPTSARTVFETEWEDIDSFEREFNSKKFHIIIDDIFTTGWTVLNTINLIELNNIQNQNKDINYLVICLARK